MQVSPLEVQVQVFDEDTNRIFERVFRESVFLKSTSTIIINASGATLNTISFQMG